MQRFIRYLYEYEQGKRMRNVGFVKVEKDDVQSIVHIHGKGLRLAGGDSLQVYLFFEEDGKVFAVPQGEIAYMGPALNYRLQYTNEDTGWPENYENIEGILLKSANGRQFAAMWDDDTIRIEDIQPWTGRMREEEEPEMSEESVPEALEEMMPEERMPEESEMVRPEEAQPDGLSPGDGTEMEAQQEEQENICPRKVTKIQRTEISMLPRCEWRLANNNFLLHGYYNYRHLVLIDDGRILKLGVPGIYHEKEARAAAGLGFPEFISAEDTKLSLTPEECNKEEKFGYWCRQVRRPAM